MDNQIQGRRKATFQKEEKVMTKGAVYCEKSVTSGLCITGLGCTRFSRNERVSWKPDAESLERNSKSSIHYVHATSREYPVQERTIVGKNKWLRILSGRLWIQTESSSVSRILHSPFSKKLQASARPIRAAITR